MGDSNQDLNALKIPDEIVSIDEALIKNSTQFLDEELKQDNVLTVPNSATNLINTNDYLCDGDMTERQWLNKYRNRLFDKSRKDNILEYHESEIKNATRILMFLLIIFSFVTLSSITLTAVCVFLEKNGGAIISGVLGSVIDTILGVTIKIFNATLESKKTYFDAECESEKLSLMLATLQTMTDTKEKDLVIAQMVRKHFNIDNVN